MKVTAVAKCRNVELPTLNLATLRLREKQLNSVVFDESVPPKCDDVVEPPISLTIRSARGYHSSSNESASLTARSAPSALAEPAPPTSPKRRRYTPLHRAITTVQPSTDMVVFKNGSLYRNGNIIAPQDTSPAKTTVSITSIRGKFKTNPYSSYPYPTSPITTPSSKPTSRLGSRHSAHSNAMTAAYAVQHHRHLLLDTELAEITNYDAIYFLGASTSKINVDPALSNSGYDDSRHDYIAIPGDHIFFRYEIISLLGTGSFGKVYKCKDHSLNTLVAVKIIRNKKKFHIAAAVELAMLQTITAPRMNYRKVFQASIVTLLHHFTFRNHVCFVFPLCGLNLYELLKSRNFQGLSMKLIVKIAKQLLHSLQHFMSCGILHCDLKPENILLRTPNVVDGDVVIVDFGSSCYVDTVPATYIQSRFYRAPEVILATGKYGHPIDLWSVACILSEIYTGRPLFGGESECDQLACIGELLGHPPIDMVLASHNRQYVNADGQLYRLISPRGKMRNIGSKSFATLFNGLTLEEPFTSFLSECLLWQPEKRLSPDKAIRHSFLSQRLD